MNECIAEGKDRIGGKNTRKLATNVEPTTRVQRAQLSSLLLIISLLFYRTLIRHVHCNFHSLTIHFIVSSYFKNIHITKGSRKKNLFLVARPLRSYNTLFEYFLKKFLMHMPYISINIVQNFIKISQFNLKTYRFYRT